MSDDVIPGDVGLGRLVMLRSAPEAGVGRVVAFLGADQVHVFFYDGTHRFLSSMDVVPAEPGTRAASDNSPAPSSR